ncbi:restriction endonuclease subunit S [Glaesserella parasuis]|uniref:restriction endonuclease subunit S n=2 Tax=Glaesserella parasuis TaxID=738 RepID=UPI0024151E35|nr:restriction endonuclease subunit S [Glaesserella parasuis]MDG4923469.1 restriction endonuclease subunit S [Glaesserella parasuis]
MSSLSNLTIHSIGGGWGKDVEDEGLELVAVIRGTDIPNLEINNIQGVPFRYETQKKIQSRLLQIGDLVIEISGGSASSKQRTGRCLYITDELLKNLGGKVIPASFCKLLRLDRKKVNSKYVYYQIKAMHLSDEIASFENQSTGISNFQFNRFIDEIRPSILDIEVQNKIVNFLEKIDLKIINNININQTLEQIAQTIFKSWFIDFDPVHAKANALASGQTLEQATQAAMAVISGKNTQELHRLQTANPEQYQQLWEIAEAFPSGVDEEGVPWGWEEKPLPELIDFLEGPGIRNWQYTEEEDGIKFINIRCIKNGDLSLETANKITREEAFGKYAHFQLKEDDIVISTSGTLGRFALVRNEHLPLCLNTSVIRFRPIENKSTLAFLLGLASNQLQYELEARASGSVQRNFGPTHLKQISVLLPDFYLLSLHNKYISTLFELRKSNLRENDLLMKTRDVLLPKLLSGEV